MDHDRDPALGRALVSVGRSSIRQFVTVTLKVLTRGGESNMASARDVAAYLLQRRLPAFEAVRLQKLLYYMQAWHLALMDSALFNDRSPPTSTGQLSVTYYASTSATGWYVRRTTSEATPTR